MLEYGLNFQYVIFCIILSFYLFSNFFVHVFFCFCSYKFILSVASYITKILGKIEKSFIGEESGKLTLDIFKMIGAPDGFYKEMEKIGFASDITFQLDKLYTGGFHVSVILNIEVIGLKAVAPELADGIDLVNLFGLPSVDCSSEALDGKKCFVVGVKETRKCEVIGGYDNSEELSGAQEVHQAATVAAAAAIASLLLA